MLSFHVEVDTGMGRGGGSPEALLEVVWLIDAAPATSIAGIWSHQADGSDVALSRLQRQRFETALGLVAATGRSIPLRRLVATEGVFVGTAPEYDMVRIGLGFYSELAPS